MSLTEPGTPAILPGEDCRAKRNTIPPPSAAAEVLASDYGLQQINLVKFGMMLNTPVFRQVTTIFREVNALRASDGTWYCTQVFAD